MSIEAIILYLLSGYGIVSTFVLIKLLIKHNKLEVESRVNNSKCEERLCKLEKEVKKHVEEDDTRLKKEMNRLDDIRKSLVGYIDVNIGTAIIDVKEIKPNISDLDIEYDTENFPSKFPSKIYFVKRQDNKDLLLG